jgi:hypothetical protein
LYFTLHDVDPDDRHFDSSTSHAEQALHEDAPGGEKDPFAHGVQVALPTPAEKLPDAHWRHDDPVEE